MKKKCLSAWNPIHVAGSGTLVLTVLCIFFFSNLVYIKRIKHASDCWTLTGLTSTHIFQEHTGYHCTYLICLFIPVNFMCSILSVFIIYMILFALVLLLFCLWPSSCWVPSLGKTQPGWSWLIALQSGYHIFEILLKGDNRHWATWAYSMNV